MRVKHSSKKAERVRQLAMSGWGCVKIQRYLGLSRSQVRRICSAHDIPLDGVKVNAMNIGNFVHSARTGKYTPHQLAQNYGIRIDRVLQLCDDYEIDLPCEPERDRYDWPEPPTPMEATSVLPGPAKVAVLRERAARGESLWHPNDVDYFGLRGGA